MNLISRMISEADRITYEMILAFLKDKELSNKCWNALQQFKQLSEEDKVNKLKKVDVNQSLIEFTTKLVGKTKRDNVLELMNELKEEIK